MAHENPLWGAPRIHGELLKLGIHVAQATVSGYMPRKRRPPSQTWRTFFRNHTVPTATFKVLYVFLVLSQDRRRVVHFNVTDSPNALWTARQLVQAFPWDTAPGFLIRDRDCIYSDELRRALGILGIEDIPTAPHSPWQKARTHLGLDKDCPESRSVEPPAMGNIVAIPQVGGLHDRYTRQAA
jgi:hypothetical protein